MMLVWKGTGPVLVPDAHLTAEPGVPVDIPEELAASLLRQPDWRKAPAKKKEG